MNLARLGFVLILVGLLIIFAIAFVVPVLLIALWEGTIEIGGGGCIVILFIPICFGYGAQHMILPMLVIAIILCVVMLITSLLVLRESRRSIKNIEFAFEHPHTH